MFVTKLGNMLEEMGRTYSKAKRKPEVRPQEKKTRLRWTKEKQLWTPDDWMEVTFSDESHIYAGQGDDAGTFVWCHSAEIHKGDENMRMSSLIDDTGLHVR